MDAMLIKQRNQNEQKPWNRLDRGIKIQKIRKWIEKKTDWPENIRTKSEALLVKAIKLGNITSSSSILYNKEECEIQEIPCLHLVIDEELGTIVDVLLQHKTKKSKTA